jgi:phosphatidylglycerol---prolipoprotein diacylglyceryl transferase
MDNFIYFWQHIPLYIDPVIFSIGSFSFRWYSLGYILAFATVLILIFWRINRGELTFIKDKKIVKDQAIDIFLLAIIGLLLGARIGYGIFYDWQALVFHPLQFFNPFYNGELAGFFGMSFHGGLIGAFLAVYIFCRIKKINFWGWLNFFTSAIGLGYFFGRMGNFFNGELFGRVTEKKIGMYFPSSGDSLLRHPSQIYEAVGEGLLIFLILWPLRNKEKYRDKMFALFLILYGVIRFVVEFFRYDEGRELILGFLTTGQFLCLIMIIVGLVLFNKKLKV